MTCLRQKRLNLNEVGPQNHGCSIAPDDVVPLRPIKSRLTSQLTTLKKLPIKDLICTLNFKYFYPRPIDLLYFIQ